jgi:ATPase subunit of ABC transporter with duplicated ATPase domains
MLQVHHLSKNFGPETVLADVSFVLNHGEHVGLIGPNGVGKSSLLRCLTGLEQPDSGAIVLSPPGSRIGYSPQSFVGHAERTLGDVLADAQADLVQAEAALLHAADERAGRAQLLAVLPVLWRQRFSPGAHLLAG